MPPPTDAVVHIVDDDEAVRDSLLELLLSAGLLTKTYASGHELLAALPPSASGCVVTDIQMPSMSGLELLERLGARPGRMPVIVLTGHADMRTAIAALKGGAVDFVEKPIQADAIIAAVQSALRGRDDQPAVAVKSPAPADLSGLTVREREVLDGLVDGHSNKIIAGNLGISPRTVEVYRANIMGKMQAATLSELLRKVFLGEREG
jgi:two-component system response regulator FixJ